ncbi:NAD(P)H-hydrate dehydratase, partial [Candidatus Bathyarchaeota archaeon]|nr:NAD(P)H-hydrate dehydratase [Candidatus Bathyarchaeota archaeon]
FSTFKRSLSNPVVITPHIGEFNKLSGNILSKNFEKRIKEVREISAKLNAVVVLKCEKDIISDSNRTKINYTGNPGMTVGGTGDVLSGIIGGLVAQKNDLFESAVAGTYVNGASGDFVAEKIGYHLLATDLLDWIPRVLENPMSHIKVRNRSVCPS